MNNNKRTAGEMVFEQYLSTQLVGFEFEKEYSGKTQRPDYAIVWRDQTIVLDVKDFSPPDQLPKGFSAFDPYTKIREKIQQGRNKFRQFKEYCCALVLYNRGQPLVMIEDDQIMLACMYGDLGFTFPVNTATGVGDASQLRGAFLGRGKMLRPDRRTPQNTTISAIITLRKIRPHYLRLLDMVHEYPMMGVSELMEQAPRLINDYDPHAEVPCVIVWHNAVARIPFPEGLFRGFYDSHVGVVEEDNAAYHRVIYRGELLPPRLKP